MDHGTIYAWSDRLEGPYREFKDDNVLIADPNGTAAGISCRSVRFQDQNVLMGRAEKGWQIGYLGAEGVNVEITAQVQLQAVAAGLVYGSTARGNLVFLLDASEGAVLATYTPGFPFLHRRQWDIQKGRRYDLRIIKRGRRFEVYVNNLLALGFFENYPDDPNAQIGVIVDRGKAQIRSLSVYALETKAIH